MRRETRTVKTLEVKARCSQPLPANAKRRTNRGECGGVLQFTGISLDMNPPAYPHWCLKCGHVENLDAIYPRIEHS